MKIGKRISTAAAVVFTLAVAGSPASAAPQGPWIQPAADLSAIGRSASYPQVTTASDGTATAVWHRYNGSNDIIQTATRPPGGSFGEPDDLSATGGSAARPQIATAPDGTTTAVWQRNDGSTDIIEAATRPPGGSFGAAVALSVTGDSAIGSQIATAPDGTTTVVWYRLNGSYNIIQAATRPPGGAFGAPVDLSVTGQDAYQPQITTAPGGTATAVWVRFNGSDNIVQAATRPPGGAFGAPVDLSAPGRDAYSPQIAFAPDGTATAVWQRYNGSNYVVQAATRPPGGSFGAAVDLSAADQGAFEPQIVTGPKGTATVVWPHFNGSYSIIQAATRPVGGSFGAPVDLSAGGQDANLPQITAAPDGSATAVWQRSNGTNNIIQATNRPVGGSFGAPVDLSAGGQDADLPQITAAPDGSATAVWRRDNGSNTIIQGASTTQPSILLNIVRGGSGVGAVSSSPAGVDCGADCAQIYPSFTKVTLTATPDPGSAFAGWAGACEDSTGNTCELTLLEDQSVTGTFEVTPGKSRLKIIRIRPKQPKIKRGKKVKLKVTGENAGDATAKDAKLCLKLKKNVRKKLKPKGNTCQKLGSLGPGKTKTRAFKLKATGKAKKGKRYKVTFKLTAKGAKAVTRAVKVKVK